MWTMKEKNLPRAATQAADINNQPDNSRKSTKSQSIQIGEKYGRLTVIEYVGKDGYNHKLFKCKCDCGNEIVSLGCNIKRGRTKSCGCYKRDLLKEIHTTHGKRNHPLYSVWRSMRKRCENPKDIGYRLYGGRGIRVCDEWNDFQNFFTWAIENGYKSGLTLDRIDVNSNYMPSNCRWASMKVQNNNKRNTIYISAYGQVHTIAEWEEITGINHETIYRRIKRRGCKDESVLLPVGKYRKAVR